MNRLILVLFLALFASESFGQFWDKFKFWKEDTLAHQEGVFIFPLLYYTPDTRFAAGMVGVYYFNTGNNNTEKGRNTRLSYVKLLGDYTQNNQLDFWSSFNIFTNEEKYLFKGELRYRNFPDRYYGVGNNTSINQEEFYSFDLMYFKLLAMRQVREKLFIGIDYQFSYEYNFSQEPEGELASQTIVGWNGGFGSGVGAVATYDTRDNVVNPFSGILFEISTYLNSSYLGGTFNYTNVNMTFNKYWEVRKNHILALNSVVFMNFGGVPFLDMARVGGDDILRGYAQNRFRDNHFAGLQFEYRFPLWWRFGMVVFTGVGDVFRNPSDLSFSNLKYSVGAGIRFAINRKERLNVRFDYGFGRRNNSFYIMLTEAF